MERYKGSMRSGGAVAWFLQRLTAVVLFLGLGVHWFVLHYTGHGEGVTYQAVIQRMSSPAWRLAEWVFLLAAIYHAVNGVLAVARDFRLSGAWRLVIVSLFWVLGATAFLLGSLTLLSFNRLP